MIDSIRKAITTCKAYCMKAIMSPTCMADSATWCAPTQMISSISPFMTSIMSGIMLAMTRFTNRFVLVRSWLARSKRASSNAWVLNARTTIMPDRFSRTTRFRRSIKLWMILNLGSATENRAKIRTIRTTTARAMIHHMEVSVPVALMMPPIPRIGA